MKTEIQFETRELTIIRIRRSQTARIFCSLCREQVLHLSVARTAAALQISETAVFRLVEDGTTHSLETASGTLFVCGNSVSELVNQKKIIEGEKLWDL